MDKNNLKLSSIKILGYVYSLALIFGLVSLIFISIFLYNNFYTTVLELSDISIEQDDFNGESINMVKFNKVINNLNIKEEDISSEEVLIDNLE